MSRGSLQEQLSSALGIPAEPDTEPLVRVPGQTVVERTPVFEDEVVVSITLDSNTRLVNSEHVGVPYLQTIAGVRGGRVYYFVYGDDIAKTKIDNSLTIVGSIKVFEKKTEDGFRSIYVDVVRLPDDTPLTHRLLVHAVTPPTLHERSVFASPVPGTGGMIEVRDIRPG